MTSNNLISTGLILMTPTVLQCFKVCLKALNGDKLASLTFQTKKFCHFFIKISNYLALAKILQMFLGGDTHGTALILSNIFYRIQKFAPLDLNIKLITSFSRRQNPFPALNLIRYKTKPTRDGSRT